MTTCRKCGCKYNATLPPSVHERECFTPQKEGACGKPGCTVPFAHTHNS